jgi:hypothetical protein
MPDKHINLNGDTLNNDDSKNARLLNLRLLLFAAVLVGYLLWNKPLYWAILHLQPIGFAFAFVVSFCGMGAPLMRRFTPSNTDREPVKYPCPLRDGDFHFAGHSPTCFAAGFHR